LAAPIIFTIIVDGLLAARAIAGDVILEKFNLIPAVFACYVENGISAPFLGIVSVTFPHLLCLLK
jgi:hypothetical protein